MSTLNNCLSLQSWFKSMRDWTWSLNREKSELEVNFFRSAGRMTWDDFANDESRISDRGIELSDASVEFMFGRLSMNFSGTVDQEARCVVILVLSKYAIVLSCDEHVILVVCDVFSDQSPKFCFEAPKRLTAPIIALTAPTSRKTLLTFLLPFLGWESPLVWASLVFLALWSIFYGRSRKWNWINWFISDDFWDRARIFKFLDRWKLQFGIEWKGVLLKNEMKPLINLSWNLFFLLIFSTSIFHSSFSW